MAILGSMCGSKIMTISRRIVNWVVFSLEFAPQGSRMSCWYCTRIAPHGRYSLVYYTNDVELLCQWCRNLGLSFMDTTGWHQLGTVTTINTLQYGINNMLRNNKHLENEHKVATANQAGCFCVSLCSPAAAVAFNRAKALLVVCFVGPSMTKCVFSYHPLLLLCLDGTDFALILVFCFCSRVFALVS